MNPMENFTGIVKYNNSMVLNSRYFNDYLRQTPEAGVAAFFDLMHAKNSLVATNNPTIKKIYKFLDLLNPKVDARNEVTALSPMEQVTWRFFDADLVKQFIAEPLNPELLNALGEQVLLVAAANGCNPFTEEPYEPFELALFVADKLDYYTHDTMLATLRSIMLGKDSLDDIPLLMTIVSETTTNYLKVPPPEYSWAEAFVWAVILHTIWFYFVALQTKDQELLIKFFFYQSIVAGVPVRERLLEMFSGDAAGDANQKWVYSLLSQSLEFVPTTTNANQLRSFSFVWVASAGELAGSAVSALAEDEQARKLYANQEGRDIYSAWMREMFHTVHLLQMGKL